MLNFPFSLHHSDQFINQNTQTTTWCQTLQEGCLGIPSITNKYLLSSFPEHFPKSVWPYTVLDIYSLVFANVMLQNMNTDCSLFHLSPCQSMWKTWLFSGHDNWISIPVSRLGARNSYYDNLWSEFKYECTNFMTKLCIGCTMRDGYSRSSYSNYIKIHGMTRWCFLVCNNVIISSWLNNLYRCCLSKKNVHYNITWCFITHQI